MPGRRQPQPDGVRLRSMREADLPSVLPIETESFATPWSERTFRSLLRRRNTWLSVADKGGQVVGYAVLWFAGPEAELGNLAVRSDRRREGIAGVLLDAVLAEVESRGTEALFLEVRIGNTAARSLYENADFTAVGLRPGYYASPKEDALVMRREFPKRVTR